MHFQQHVHAFSTARTCILKQVKTIDKLIEYSFKNRLTMCAKYKLTRRKNPIKKTDTPLWYAIPSVVNRQTTREVCKIVTRGSTTYPTEAESSFNLVVDGIPHELQLGSSVQLGRLGWIRLSFGSEGVEDITKFDAASMIKNIKVIFTPSKELMAEIKNGLTFENVGVVEEGFTFPDTRSYLTYKETGQLPVQGGTGTGGSTEEPGGGTESGGDEETDDPLA